MYQTMGLLPTLRITVNPIWWLLLHNFFDESLNQTFYTFYKDWMVLLVWFWDLEDDIAHVILNHNWWDVQVLLTFSKHTFSFDIDKPNLLQVSSVGPNVNLLFLNNFAEQWNKVEFNSLINIWLTHGLHTIHDCLKMEKALEISWKVFARLSF